MPKLFEETKVVFRNDSLECPKLRDLIILSSHNKTRIVHYCRSLSHSSLTHLTSINILCIYLLVSLSTMIHWNVSSQNFCSADWRSRPAGRPGSFPNSVNICNVNRELDPALGQFCHLHPLTFPLRGSVSGPSSGRRRLKNPH